MRNLESTELLAIRDHYGPGYFIADDNGEPNAIYVYTDAGGEIGREDSFRVIEWLDSEGAAQAYTTPQPIYGTAGPQGAPIAASGDLPTGYATAATTNNYLPSAPGTFNINGKVYDQLNDSTDLISYKQVFPQYAGSIIYDPTYGYGIPVWIKETPEFKAHIAAIVASNKKGDIFDLGPIFIMGALVSITIGPYLSSLFSEYVSSASALTDTGPVWGDAPEFFDASSFNIPNVPTQAITELLDAPQPDYMPPAQPSQIAPPPEPVNVPEPTQIPGHGGVDIEYPTSIPTGNIPVPGGVNSLLPSLADLPKLLTTAVGAGLALKSAAARNDLNAQLLRSNVPPSSLLPYGSYYNPLDSGIAPQSNFGQTFADLTRSPYFWAAIVGGGALLLVSGRKKRKD